MRTMYYSVSGTGILHPSHASVWKSVPRKMLGVGGVVSSVVVFGEDVVNQLRTAPFLGVNNSKTNNFQTRFLIRAAF